MKFLIPFLLLASAAFAQTAPVHTVTLTWTWTQGTGGLATGYVVYKAPATGTTCPAIATFTQLATVTAEATMTYVDTNASPSTSVLTEGSTYCYAVTATDQGGASPDSNIASATVPFSPPIAPVLGTPSAK
jgi:hypothetical protein